MADKSSCCSLVDFLRWFLFAICTFNILAQLVILSSLTWVDTFLGELSYPGLAIRRSDYVRTIVLLALSFVGSYGAATANLEFLRVYALSTLLYVVVFLCVDIERDLTSNWMETRDKFELEMKQLASEYQFNLKPNETANNATKRWDLIQSTLACCGLKGPQDWPSWRNDTGQVLPKTCCPSSTFYHKDACRLDEPFNRDKGCLVQVERIGCGANIAQVVVHALVHIWLACIALAIVRHRGRERSFARSLAARSSMI